MGVCCSTEVNYKSVTHEKPEDFLEEKDDKSQIEDQTMIGPDGAIIRLQGSSTYTSMYTRKGKKGINQDAMIIWENFMGEKNAFFCGVFDGHGPSGHKVARYVSDALPSKLCSIINMPQLDACERNGAAIDCRQNKKYSDNSSHNETSFSSEESLIKAFKELDEDLNSDDSVDAYTSGSTAVTILKQGEHLVISNLGDSRAVLCSRNSKNQLTSIQLTVDLKPTMPSESDRILRCGGRVFAMNEEPNVPRVWMPNQDCPGLAMTRAFGDFCIKDYGLSSTPDVSYRRLTSKDEFIVLATDGVWDVLSNNEVIQIVASVKKRSNAAKLLVYYAVQAWKTKYPGSRVDDCAVICLFLKKRPLLLRSMTDMDQLKASTEEVAASRDKKTDEGETLINCDVTMDPKTFDELNRVNACLKQSSLAV